MLDIQFIRENKDLVSRKSTEKGYNTDIMKLLELDSRRRLLINEVQQLQQQSNELAAASKGAKPFPEQIEQGKTLKQQVTIKETELKPLTEQFMKLWEQVPNLALDNVPVGATEDENQVVKTVGEPRKLDFKPKSDGDLGELHDTIDKERAAKVAGARFAYLKGDVVRLQFAIIHFVLDCLGNQELITKLIQDNGLKLKTTPFTPVIPPAVIKTGPYADSARLNAEEVTYKLADDELWLNASAEHSLCTMYIDEILDEKNLPIRYVGYSTSFRREAGTYGKDTEGIFRMHQFDKLEMEVFSTPETGLDEHKLLVALQEYLVQQLELPYQLIQKCTADIGKPNAQGVDINTWMPAQDAYRETHTADYMTDYQARRLRTKLRRSDGKTELVHTNDATAFALGRIIKAILENYQNADGTVGVPKVLKKYLVQSEGEA